MKKYRINVEHSDLEVEEKIEGRDVNRYPTKRDYILAAVRKFNDENSEESLDVDAAAELRDRISELEEKMKRWEKRFPDESVTTDSDIGFNRL